MVPFDRRQNFLYFLHTDTHTHSFNGPFSGTTQVSRYQIGKNLSGFYWSKRQWVAVASAGPCASLHLASDRQPHQQPTTLFYTGRMPTNSIKALKATIFSSDGTICLSCIVLELRSENQVAENKYCLLSRLRLGMLNGNRKTGSWI